MGIAICNLCGVKARLGRKVFRKNLGMGEWAPPLPPHSAVLPPPPFWLGGACRGVGVSMRGRGVVDLSLIV
jgi:hypothetical protein